MKRKIIKILCITIILLFVYLIISKTKSINNFNNDVLGELIANTENNADKEYFKFQNSFSVNKVRALQDNGESERKLELNDPKPFIENLSIYTMGDVLEFKYSPYRLSTKSFLPDTEHVSLPVSLVYEDPSYPEFITINIFTNPLNSKGFYPVAITDLEVITDDYKILGGFVLIQKQISVDFENSYGYKQIFDQGAIYKDEIGYKFSAIGDHDKYGYLRYILKSKKTGKIIVIESPRPFDQYIYNEDYLQSTERLLDTIAATIRF